MKKLVLFYLILFLFPCSNSFGQKKDTVNGSNICYLTENNLCNLQKTKKLVCIYNQYQNSKKKNKDKLWVDTKGVIELSRVQTDSSVILNQRNFMVLYYYKRIVFRYQLVKKHPKSYKRFWAGWYTRYMYRLLPYYKKL